MATYVSGESARIKTITLVSGSGTPTRTDCYDSRVRFSGEVRNVTPYEATYQVFILVKATGSGYFDLMVDGDTTNPPIVIGNKYTAVLQSQGTDTANVYNVSILITDMDHGGRDRHTAPVQYVRYSFVLSDTAPTAA